VAIARALLQAAPVLLLDEPLAGVDRVSAEHLERVFGQLRNEGRTLLIATHDVEAAKRADRVLCLAGRQVAYGAPGETLTAAVLRETYGAELVVLDGDRAVVTVEHGCAEHEHA